MFPEFGTMSMVHGIWKSVLGIVTTGLEIKKSPIIFQISFVAAKDEFNTKATVSFEINGILRMLVFELDIP